LTEELASRRALLVVDNVPEKLVAGLGSLLPVVGGQGRTLLTSRCRTLHQHLPAPARSLDLDCWTRDSAIGYMRELGSRCKNADETELGGLAEFVGFLPLGVRLIGLLLERRVSKSPSGLLEDVRRQPLASLDSAAMGIDRGVAQTFMTAFEAVDERERRVFLTLSACARATSDTIVAEVCGLSLDDAQLALEQLRECSLAEFVERSESPWGMHDVVRLFAQAQPSCGEIMGAHQHWATKHCTRWNRPEQYADFARGADDVAEVVRRLIREN
jgi:hypothetical protein